MNCAAHLYLAVTQATRGLEPCWACLRVFLAYCGKHDSVVKKLLLVFLAGFVIYFLITSPSSAAEAVRTASSWIGVAFKQVGVFVTSLAS